MRFAVLLALAGLTLAPAAPTMYVTYYHAGDPTDTFGTVDLASGAIAPLATLPFVSGGLGHGPSGHLYTLNNETGELVRLAADGSTTVIGPTGYSGYFWLSSLNGTLYALRQNMLYQINAITAEATLIGGTGVPFTDGSSTTDFFSGLTPLDGVMYFAYQSYTVDANQNRVADILPNALYRLNLATGAATKIADLPSLTNIFTGHGGQLYAVLDADASWATVNPSTGAITPYLLSPGDALIQQAVPTPEPGTLLTGFAALALVAVRAGIRGRIIRARWGRHPPPIPF